MFGELIFDLRLVMAILFIMNTEELDSVQLDCDAAADANHNHDLD
jgi:hypothetical protein